MHQNDEIAEFIYKTKHLQQGETLEEGAIRFANATKDGDEHFKKVRDIVAEQYFLPAGRVLSATGAARSTTSYNCFVSDTIGDSMADIHRILGEALETMRLGGGIGYDYSTLRPVLDRIRTLDSHSSGPVGNHNIKRGFMDLFDAGCAVISSAGHRRGAQMAVLRVDHPDILHFIRSKRTPGRLTNFNISVGVTDDFMGSVERDSTFDLVFGGRVYETVRARNLWDEIMRSTWDYAEPGVLFLDTINRKNNLWYCETIAATNPCGEQPLPPYGACLLGSFNLTKYIIPHMYTERVTDEGCGPEYQDGWEFDWEKFQHDIPYVVRAMDNVVDRSIYPLERQELEARRKRRMGLGVTGLANTAEVLGYHYGSPEMVAFTEHVLQVLRDSAYTSSVELAIEKGPFPLFDRDKYCYGNPESFIGSLRYSLAEEVYKYGIRNSHLLSIAPTGSISLGAGNISSGIEPPYTTGLYTRNVFDADGSVRTFKVMDYAEANYGAVGKTSDETTLNEHLDVLAVASKYVDSAVSKTCNVGPHVTFDEFKDVYLQAYKRGCKGITTFRPAEYGGKREGIMTKEQKETPDFVAEGGACYFDEQGNRTCDS